MPLLSRARLRRLLGVSLALACSAGPASALDKVKVVASFSILGDFVKNIGGAHVEVTSLVGPNSDPHVFEPAPADARRITDAKIVVVNGLGLEGWLNRLITVSSKQALIVVATQGVTPRWREDDRTQHDPHAWQSVAKAEIYAANIRDALVAVDSANKSDYESNYSAYLAKLTALDQEIRDIIMTIPPSRRRILTTHDAFGYFSDAYGIVFIGLQGVSTDAEPSAQDVASTIQQAKQQKITALFLENTVNPAQIRRIAEETGAKIGGILYSDALTEADGEAPTYIDLMRHNIEAIASALRG